MFKREKSAQWGINVLLLAGSSVLFALSHPNVLVHKGIPFFAYFSLLPFFLLLHRVSFRASFLWGGLYGSLSYVLFAYWLFIFHPLAGYIIAALYFFYCMITGALLKLADMYFPRYGFIVQWLIWLGYEYVKTLGFLGFSYGIMGYSQWSSVPFIQIASLFGVWAVSAIVCFPSAWLAAGIRSCCDELGNVRSVCRKCLIFLRTHALSACVWFVCFTAALSFGFFCEKASTEDLTKKIALIQPNEDPWIGGITAYKKDLDTLKKLSDMAIREEPLLDLVVWPETAFIPRINWHYRYREDADSFELVHDLLTYLNVQSVPFLIGNDDAVKALTAEGVVGRVDYNAALLFVPKKTVFPPNPERYRKMHLVPFTEHFPYRRQFPFIYTILVENDTHFWAKGTDIKVFSLNGMNFSVPICFEDTFGYISRRFANNGAKMLINMSNDAWAKSIPCQYQHLSMGVFRAVENRLPLLRATASGQTAAVTRYGRITAMLEPLQQGYLCTDVCLPAENGETLYSRIGDVLGLLFTIIAGMLLLAGLIKNISYRKHV